MGDRRLDIEIDELERFEGIKDRMARRACQCGHCDDLRWMLALLERVARREIVYTDTEREFQNNHKEETASA